MTWAGFDAHYAGENNMSQSRAHPVSHHTLTAWRFDVHCCAGVFIPAAMALRERYPDGFRVLEAEGGGEGEGGRRGGQ
jgi:hypothetical protein